MIHTYIHTHTLYMCTGAATKSPIQLMDLQGDDDEDEVGIRHKA